MVLIFNENVKVLENQNQWNEVIEFLDFEWEKNKTDLNNYLCLCTEIWYVLVFYMREHMKNISENILVQKLANITKYGFENFQNEIYFNAVFGYMIALMPYYFPDFDDYFKQQNRGINMMKKAYMEDKSNPFLAAIYFSSIGDAKKFKESCILFTQNKEKYFSEDEAVGSYFIRILSH